MEKIAIVNEKDEIIGFEEKMYVHEKGILHRAFSVVIYNVEGKMLLQQRSYAKYHSPGLWTNACCSHQLEKDKDIIAAAHRRLEEELGIQVENLKIVGLLDYQCSFENNLIENELDTLMIGYYDGEISFNHDEINDIKWIEKEELVKWKDSKPEEFTYWFRLLLDKI